MVQCIYIYYKMIVCWVSNRNPPLLFRQSNLASLDFGYREFHYNFSPKSHWCQWPESCESPLSWCSLVADCFREKLEDCRSRLKLHDSWIPKWGLKSKLLKFQNQSCDIPTKSSAFCRVFFGVRSIILRSSVAVILCDYQAEPKLQHQCWYYFWCLKSWTTLICYCYKYPYDLEGSPTMSTASRYFVHQP